nr:MAG: hypothetical protein TU35_01910 [Thermoproteus sp. AZ2]
MDLLCVERLSCTPADHRAEAEEAQRRFPTPQLLERVVDAPQEALRALKLLKGNGLGIKGRAYAFLSGSLIVECGEDCGRLKGLADAGLAEALGRYIYIPYTALDEKILEHLPLEEEEVEVKRAYIASVEGINTGEELTKALTEYLSSSGYFLGRRIEKALHDLTYIPQLVNKYIYKINILLKLDGNYIVGINYIDIRRTVHLGFSAVEGYLSYGLDYAVLLHPYVDHRFHKSIAGRMAERGIGDAGYMAIDLINEILYIYKFPKYNSAFNKYMFIHSNSRAIRSYIENL